MNLFDCELLNHLPPKLVEDYLAQGIFIKKTYEKNELIHLEGEVCKQIEIVCDGEIAVERIDESGRLLTVNIFTRNMLVGANLIFSTTNHYPMTVTSKKQSHAIVIEKELLFQLCNQYPNFLLQFIQIISDLSVIIGTKVKQRVSRTIKESIISFLGKQYSLQNSKKIILPTSKKDLAERMGVSRSSFSRELQKMKNQGLIDFDSKSITILQQEILP